MTSLKRPLEGPDQTSGLSSKVFVRSTRNGKVQKVVRELYLRQDIPCSSRLCSVCQKYAPSDASGNVLPFILSGRPPTTKSHSKGYYLLPDTNVFLNAMDLFEQAEDIHDVIVLQTVLEELKNRSLPLYNRLIGLIRSEDKRFYVFFNEFRLETYVLREAGESINDRNDRAVRRSTQWYQQHLQDSLAGKRASCPDIVMLSDDKENLRRAQSEGVQATSVSNFVKQLKDADRLLDMLAANAPQSTGRSARGANRLYPEYFSASKINTELKAGTIHQGSFTVSPYNYLEGTVHVSAFEKPLLVLGREEANRAVAGDVVAVQVLPQARWKTASTQIVEEETITKNDNPEADESGTIVTASESRALQEDAKRALSRSSESKTQPTARVVGIIKRNWRQYVGHVDNATTAGRGEGRRQETVSVIPMDKRIPKIKIRTRQASELIGKRLLVTIDAWEPDSRYPMGHFVRSLGDLESKGAETEALLLEYDVQYRPFPKVVLDCLPTEGHDWKVPADTDGPGWRSRRDLRSLLVCSIDPPGCQDIDDALHARKLPNGHYEVGVHIADVSHFVKPQNAMDAEASLRGTTVYLVDKRIDMLPMLLGTDLCSLKPHVERFAFSVLWEITEEAEVVDVSFTKSVIRSRDAFSYEQAQNRIDDRSKQDELTQSMRTLLMLSKKFRQKRMDAGALNLASPEIRVQTESETSDPIDVKTKEMLETNSLVEEFMLLANISVAGRIYSAFPQTALLRRHAAPPPSNFDELARQLRVRRGLELQTGSSRAVADSLDTCVDPAHPFFNTLVRIMATRCMMSAEYFCAGTQTYEQFRHYGLASAIYTHFTSPIRRYADLVAHRQLAAAIEYEAVHPSLQSQGQLEAVCKNLNLRHRNAQLAGRASVEYYVGQALKGRVCDEDAYVLKVFSNGLVAFVPRFGIESLIRLRDLAVPEPHAEFDADEYILRLSGSREATIGLFDQIRVRIADVLDPSTNKRKLKMELL